MIDIPSILTSILAAATGEQASKGWEQDFDVRGSLVVYCEKWLAVPPLVSKSSVATPDSTGQEAEYACENNS